MLYFLKRVQSFFYGRLAQLARASRLHREGQEFESLTAYQIKKRHIRGVFFIHKIYRVFRFLATLIAFNVWDTPSIKTCEELIVFFFNK